MAKRTIFRVRTPLGYHVVLTRDRWREITRYKHPALANQEKLLKECLETPDNVRSSTKDDEVHLYYRRSTRIVCVVVAPSGNEQGDYFVVTAYFTKNIKEGNELWTK